VSYLQNAGPRVQGGSHLLRRAEPGRVSGSVGCSVTDHAEQRAATPQNILLGRHTPSVLLASVLSILVLWTGQDVSVMDLAFATAFLFIVVQQDVSRTRIPNMLTFPAFAAALGLAALRVGLNGLVLGFMGATLVFLVLLLPFAARAIRAGDVKALMVLGALWGPTAALGLLFWSTVFGSAIAIVLLTLRGGMGEMLGRWWNSLGATLALGRWTYFAAAPDAAARTGLPYGVPIALAVVALQRWGLPWSVA